MDESTSRAQTEAQSGMIYLLWAVMFADGLLRVLARDDIPFGILQISVPVAAVLLFLTSAAAPPGGRFARRWWRQRSVVESLRSVEDLIEGAVILAVAPLVIVVWRLSNRKRRESSADAKELG